MNKHEEKLKVLREACEKVADAMDAIEEMAEELGVTVSLEKGIRDQEVTVHELADMVADELEMKPECVFSAIECAFELIRDLNLTIKVVEAEDDDEE